MLSVKSSQIVDLAIREMFEIIVLPRVCVWCVVWYAYLYI